MRFHKLIPILAPFQPYYIDSRKDWSVSFTPNIQRRPILPYNPNILYKNSEIEVLFREKLQYRLEIRLEKDPVNLDDVLLRKLIP